MGGSFDINKINELANLPSWFLAFPLLIVLISLWSLLWKGMALWRAGRRGDKVWFVLLLVVNTMGILEILYLFVFSKEKQNEITDERVGIRP